MRSTDKIEMFGNPDAFLHHAGKLHIASKINVADDIQVDL